MNGVKSDRVGEFTEKDSGADKQIRWRNINYERDTQVVKEREGYSEGESE